MTPALEFAVGLACVLLGATPLVAVVLWHVQALRAGHHLRSLSSATQRLARDTINCETKENLTARAAELAREAVEVERERPAPTLPRTTYRG